MNSRPRFAFVFLSWCASLSAQSPAGIKAEVGPTVEITRSHGWCWFPTVHRFPTGELMVGVTMSPDQINSESLFSAICLSRDQGKSWTQRSTMGQGASQDGTWSDVPDDAGMIWQFGAYPEPEREGDSTHFFVTMTKFGQAGRTSSEDREVRIELNQPVHLADTWLYAYRFDGKTPIPDTKVLKQFSGRPWGNIISDGQGAWLTSAYFTTEADNRREETENRDRPAGQYLRFNRDVLLRSTDAGQTWLEYGVIAAPPPGPRPHWVGNEGFNEGSLARLKDGRLYAIYRSGGKEGMLGQGWSSDGGKTWTAPASTGFHGVAPRVHRLTGGALVLVTGRPGPVVLRFSADGTGERWSEPVAIFSEMSTRYADVVEIEPGKLLVVYDSLPYGWMEIPAADRDARNRVLGTFVTVR